MDRGFLSSSSTNALPHQEELLACAGELAALACVVLRPGDAAAEAVRVQGMHVCRCMHAIWRLSAGGLASRLPLLAG